MPLYEYRCPVDGSIASINLAIGDYERSTPPVCECGISMTRRFSFGFHREFAPHFNHSLGRPVTSKRDFREGLKLQSEHATMNTGIEHHYEPVDPGEPAAYGVTTEGLEETHRRHHNAGEPGWKKDRV